MTPDARSARCRDAHSSGAATYRTDAPMPIRLSVKVEDEIYAFEPADNGDSRR